MSFEFYPAVNKDHALLRHKEVYEREVRWLVEELIKPELPSLKETLLQCHELLVSEQSIKLPLSSYQSEYIKGVITRRNFSIVSAEILFKNVKSLNHGRTTKIKIVGDQDDNNNNPNNNEVVIRQLVDCNEFILKSVHQIDELMAQTWSNGDEENAFHLRMMDELHNLLISVSTSLNYLKTPNADYLFPKQRTLSTKFEPQLPDTVALEFFINDNDLFMEFHELQHVQMKPWSVVDQVSGRSFVDELRLRISKDRRKSINTIITEEQDRVINSGSTNSSTAGASSSSAGHSVLSSPIGSDHSFTSSFTSLFHNQAQKKQENLKLLENCVTYENNDHRKCVVMVKKNLEISTSDPLLMSVATKLGSVESNLMRFYENLIIAVDD